MSWEDSPDYGSKPPGVGGWIFIACAFVVMVLGTGWLFGLIG
jgi:hypothetical protein